jgi:hypothetical protein
MAKQQRQSGADTIIRAFESARSMWQAEIRLINGVHKLELIQIGRGQVLVQDYPDGDGWQAFVPVTDSGEISETIKAISARCEAVLRG